MNRRRSVHRGPAAAAVIALAVLAGAAVAAHACTSFCMDTPDGPFYGSNCDLFVPGDGLVFVNLRGVAKESYFANARGEKAPWVSRYGSVTLNLAGRELAWAGLNEAGLVASTMELRASECADPDERAPIGAGYLVQYVLDACGSVDEAVAAVSQLMPHESECNDHFMVADAAGNAAALEFLDGEFVCHTGADMPVHALTNMPYARALAAWKRGGARWWWSNPGQSAERFAGAAARCEAYDPAAGDAVGYALDTLAHVVAAGHTRWNVVFDLKRREMWYRSVRSPDVKHVALDAFDFACDRPLLMLDLNAPLAGEVAEHFVPYDHEVNLQAFEVFCARWGVDVSHADAVGLMSLFDGFGCTGTPAAR